MLHLRGEYISNSSLVNSPPCKPQALWDFISFSDTEEKGMELFPSKPMPSLLYSSWPLLPPQYFIQVVCDDVWLGCDTVLPVPFRGLVSPENCPYPTVLLDVQPLPVAALRSPAYEYLYQEFKHFNPLQTKVFNVLYNSDDNVLVAAPTGSGKTICSEFAILRNHQEPGFMRVVYIAPRDALAKERYSDWSKKFGDGIGMRVVQLTGETTTDLKLVEEGEVVISTPEKWDALSRRWEHVQQEVSLFIVDGLHQIGGLGGPVLEVIVSRMRYIASQLEKKMRFVALSTSVVNSKDLGEWIGATSHGLFNVPLGPKRVPLGKYIRGIDGPSIDAMRDMNDRIYSAIAEHVKSGKAAILYVPSRERVENTAFGFETYLRLDSGQRASELQRFVESIKERMLRQTLDYGVGYLHEGMSRTDQDIVKTLFENGWTRLCVISSTMFHGVPLSENLVVVMGAQPQTDSLEITVDSSSQPVLDKLSFEAFPVESQLLHCLHEYDSSLNNNNNNGAKVVCDAVDYLRWSFMYKRRAQNPSYYHLQNTVSYNHPWRRLYELVKNKLSDLDLEASRLRKLEFYKRAGAKIRRYEAKKLREE